MSQCRSPKCRASILWRTSSPTGATLCLDAEPVTAAQAEADPSHLYTLGDEGRSWPNHYATPATLATADRHPLHRSHWRTCLDRDRFKR